MSDNLDKFISYAIENGSDANLELECRFGKYNKLTSNIKPDTFFSIYNLFKSRSKTYSFIKDILYEDIRKRTVVVDSKNYVKSLFDNHKEENMIENKIEEYAKTYGKIDKDSIYLTKDKVFKPIQSENIKIDLVMENPNPPNTPSKNATYQKNKFRCSLKGLWNLDMTILMITDLKNNKSGLYFEVELEFNYKYFISKNLTHDDVSAEFNQSSNAILTSIDCARNTLLDIELRYSIFNQVVTLERQHLPILTNAKYAVCDKADGERKFIYIDSNKNVFILNPTSAILDKILIGKSAISSCLIDGELISNDNSGEFLGFDLLFFNGKDYRNYNLLERLAHLKTAIAELNKLKTTTKITFKIKTFYMDNVFVNAAKIWNTRENLFFYQLDGLIFTPIRGSYQVNLPNFKYKEKHSIDVRIMYNPKFNFTEFHPNAFPYMRKGSSEISNSYTDHQTGNVYYTQRINTSENRYKQMNLVNIRGDLGVTGQLTGAEHLKNMVDIVEIEYEPKYKKWVYLRTRPDKEKPNAYKSIISVMDAISDNITIDEIAKMKHIQSPYELVAKSSKAECYSNIGFNFTSPDIESNMCKFYTQAYSQIMAVSLKSAILEGKLNSKELISHETKSRLATVADNSILILGCDMCVLRAAAEQYKNILVIDPNCLEVYGDSRYEGYSGLKEFARVSGIKATIVWGSIDVSDGLDAFTKDGQTEINSFMKSKAKSKTFDTVFINSFVNIIYNPKQSIFDKGYYEKNMKTIKSLTQHIIGIYLNGTQIIKHLENQDCLLTKNKQLHPLYKLYLKSKNLSKYFDLNSKKNQSNTDIFKIKSTNIKMVEIQRMQNSFITQYQPLLFDNNIQDIIKDVKKISSLKSLYPNFKQEVGVIDDYDVIIADITKYFVIVT